LHGSLGYSVTLQNDTFLVDEANGYFEFSLNITLPIQLYPTDATIAQTCLGAFGNYMAALRGARAPET